MSSNNDNDGITVSNPINEISCCQYISKLPLFSHLGEKDIRALAKMSVEVQYKTGITITEENDFIDCFFIILAGKVEITKKIASEGTIKDIIITVLGEFESIGLTNSGFLVI